MAVGALFFAFNVAPTQEMVLIAYKMTPWHALALALASLAMLHALVYSVGFAGQEDPGRESFFASVFARFTVVGYVLALAVSAYVLWTFGRADGTSATQIVVSTIVLGSPAALGAALARLII